MLGNFFQLDEPFDECRTQADFVSRLTATQITDILYRPDEFAPRTPKYRIRGKIFKNVSFSKTRLRAIDFRECSFEDCLFVATEIVDCEFHDCTFANCNTHKIVIENTYVDPEAFARMLHPEQHANIGIHLFQQLLQNSTATQQSRFRDTAEFYFRVWRLHQWRYDRKTGRINTAQFVRKWTPEFAYLWLAGFGLRSRYFAFWTMVFFATIVYVNHRCWTVMEIANSGNPVPDTSLIQSMYFSFVTLTTLGYGDLVPTSQTGMGVITVESVFGIVWVSILASIIIRRIVR